MSDKPSWERDGLDWPHRGASRFVRAASLRWHVQMMGAGPPILLIHGTGAATHSWAGIAPHLAEHFSLVIPDLPGHAFTETPAHDGLSLSGMAQALAALLATLGVAPTLVVGHSAGAAIAMRMTLDRSIRPRGLVSVNGAVLPVSGTASLAFRPIARALGRSALIPKLFAWRAGRRPEVVGRLIERTGSALDPRGVELYWRLFRAPGHAAAVLAMMAAWDLPALRGDLHRLAVPVLMIAARRDRTIPPSQSEDAAKILPDARAVTVPTGGHLVHEEQPALVAELIVDFARSLRSTPTG